MNDDQLEKRFVPEPMPEYEAMSLVWLHRYPEAMVKPLIEAATASLQRHNHQCYRNFALLGPPRDCAKLAQAFTGILRLPFVPIRSLCIETINDLFVTVAQVCEETVVHTAAGDFNLEVVLAEPPPELVHLRYRYFSLPALVCFIDDIEDLPDVALRRVLKATNRSYGLFETEFWVVECRHACFMLGSRNRRLLEKTGLEVVEVRGR